MPVSRRWNIPLTILGEGIWGLNTGLVQPLTVFVVLLREHGAGSVMIGSVSAVQTGCVLFPQILGTYVFTSRRRRQRHLVIWHYLVMVPCLFLTAAICFYSESIPPAYFRLSVLACFTAFYFGVGVCNAAFTDWLASLFPERMRGTVLGGAWSLAALASAASSILAGRYLRSDSSASAYAGLYLAAGLFACLSLGFYALINDREAFEAPEPRRLTTNDLLLRFRQSLTDENFRAFLIGRLLSTAGFGIVPFVAVYYGSPEGGNLSPGTLVSLGAAMSVGTAIGQVALGRLGDLLGHRSGVLLGAASQTATLLILLLTSGSTSCLAAYFLIGICIASAFISHYNMLFETCPHDHRFAHITVGNLVLGTGTIISPLVAGWVAKTWGLTVLFTVSLMLTASALVWFVAFVKEPRHLIWREGVP